MNSLKLLLIFFLLSASVCAQKKKFTEVDTYAATLPSEYARKIDTLAYRLTYKYSNDIDNVRSIFVWIADNISYEGYKYVKKNLAGVRTDPEGVLFCKQTICEGYANLFKKLCDLSGITCLKISGDAREITYENGGTFAQKAEGHAWNIVKIDTNFFIVDATWGSGSVDDEGVYYKIMDEEYFLANPERICWSHYPSDPAFQLLDTPLTYSQFFEDTITEKPVYVNYRDSINKMLTFSSEEYEIATARNQNSDNKMELRRIICLKFETAEQEYRKAKTPEEKASAKKTMDAVINYIRKKNLGMKEYIERAEFYKRTQE